MKKRPRELRVVERGRSTQLELMSGWLELQHEPQRVLKYLVNRHPFMTHQKCFGPFFKGFLEVLSLWPHKQL